MGGSDLPQADSIGSLFANLEAKVAMQATSQGLGNSKVQGGATEYTDVNGNETINQGTYTYLTGPWAGVTLRGSTIYFDPMGNPIMVLGPQPDGKIGIGFYNPAGTRLTFIDSTVGVTVSDTSGAAQVSIGQVNAGPAIYGLAVKPVGLSTMQLVAGTIYAPQQNVLATAVTSWTAVSGSSVTATVGPSGSAVVSIGADIATGEATAEGRLAVGVDGSTPAGGAGASGGTGVAVSESAGPNGMQATVGSSVVFSGLTAGSHTFQAYVITANVTTGINFYNCHLSVAPL